MTVSAIDTFVRAAGNGVATVFNFAFKVFDGTDLIVRDVIDATQACTILVLDTDYQVFASSTGEGGSVQLTTALPTGHTLDIRSVIPLQQPEDIRNQGRFLPELHEGIADRNARQIQDTRRVADASIRIPDGELLQANWDALLSNQTRKGKYLGYFNADTGDLELFNSIGATILSQSAIGAFLDGPFLGSFLYARTNAEILASVTPVNTAYVPGHIYRYGVNTVPGTTEMATAVQAAHNQGKQSGGARPYLPGDDVLISTTIDPCRLGMYGAGSQRSRLICNACHAFTISSAAGWDRPQAVFEQFAVDSNNGTSCDANFVFYFGGVGSGAAAVYNSGFIARDITIGRNHRMGGGFYLKDVFSANISNISMTDVSRGVQIVGSVVQCTFENISAFGDNAGTTLSRYGCSTESALYAGSTTLTPEHITTKDCSWIVFDRGVNHTAGLDVNFYDTDTQTISFGMFLDAPCDVKGGIHVPHTAGVTGWVGIRFGVSPGTKDARFVESAHILVGNTPGTVASSYAFDIGDGVSPCFGAFIRTCRVTGNAASLQNLIRGRICKEVEISSCVLDHAVASSSDIALTSAQRVRCVFNHCSGGTFAIGDGGDATATGQVEFNQISTLTMSPMTTRSNWKIDINDAIKRKSSGANSVADGGTITHGLSSTPTVVKTTPTIASQMASVTAAGATTFTVAIKTDAGAAGTTQQIYWSAEY